MPAEDQGDLFLRHRGAVLDTLLSDPSFGSPEFTADDAPAGPSATVNPNDVGAVADSDSMPSVRKVNSGPKASDRIMALLSGESPAGSAQLEFTSDFSERSARLGAAGEESEQRAAAPPDSREKTDRTSAGGTQFPQVVLAQLRKPKIALAVAAGLALLLVLVLVTTGGKKSDHDQLAVVTPVAAAPPSSKPGSGPESAPSESNSAPIKVRSAQAHCPAGSTDAMDAFSGEPGKAWSCVRAFKIDGQVMTIDLGKKYQVDSIGIVPGWDSVGSDGADQWNKYRTVSRVSYLFDDPTATRYTQQTLDQRSLVVTKMSPAVSASKITLTIQQSKGDPSINTTAISSIVITGH
ncbi:hypothetical protein FHY52_36550 [Nocardia nova]|uniref:hypothetical protein n=1 Tax=Nocardia nova TaxID=37330 RepID=UPI0025B20D40|nr:hypothetical protein [Nocardia nova]MDN2502161.1 hypothetical protein [Nocardia nova]